MIGRHHIPQPEAPTEETKKQWAITNQMDLEQKLVLAALRGGNSIDMVTNDMDYFTQMAKHLLDRSRFK